MRHEIPLPVAAPFDLEATVRVLQRRARNPVDRWDGERWRGVVHGALVAVRNAGTVSRPDLRLEGEPQAAPVVAARLGLASDVSALGQALDALPGDVPARGRLLGLRAPRYGTLFEALLSVIPFQQVSLDAGSAFFERLARRYGTDHGEVFALPTPKVLAQARVEELRALGFSQAKARALIGGAERVGEFDERWLQAAPLEEAIPALRRLPGVGPWSAQLILLRGYGRLDAFPPGDSGIARSLTLLTGGKVTPAEVEALARTLGDGAGWLYYLSLAAQLFRQG